MRYLTRGGIVFAVSLLFSIATIAQEVSVQVPQPTVTTVDIAIQNDFAEMATIICFLGSGR